MKLELRLSQKLILTPQLRQAIEILQMSALELREKIESELQDNPFLDEEEAETPAESGEKQKEEERRERDEVEDYFQDSSDRGYVRKAGRSEDFIEGTVSRPDSLKEHLLWQLRLSTGLPEMIRIGEMIIGNLNDDGFLSAPCGELADILKTTEREVETVLKLIQSFEPWGVGARDLRECLLIQLAQIHPRDPLAERIVSEHFDLLVHRKIPLIQKALDISRKTLDRSLETIGKLNPRPGQEYDHREVVYVVPDVIVKRVDDRFLVFLNDRVTPQISINGHYDQLLKNYGAKDSAKKFMEEKCFSALWLIRNIEQRKVTVIKVVNQILALQSAFFEKGPRHLVPLTLKAIADAIEMHESTISRVTHHKYIQTPWGIFEMKYFFSSRIRSQSGGDDLSSRSVKELLKDLVAHEEHATSDAHLVLKLGEMGVKISRRTVTKYRKFLRILPSHLRKK